MGHSTFFLKGNDMKTLEDRIHFVLDNTILLCEDIATLLNCPVTEVHKVVEERWKIITDDKDFVKGFEDAKEESWNM
jgi:hypothetical protein